MFILHIHMDIVTYILLCMNNGFTIIVGIIKLPRDLSSIVELIQFYQPKATTLPCVLVRMVAL